MLRQRPPRCWTGLPTALGEQKGVGRKQKGARTAHGFPAFLMERTAMAVVPQ
jgi:hypothetical protein